MREVGEGEEEVGVGVRAGVSREKDRNYLVAG